jgi:hypothetical protein
MLRIGRANSVIPWCDFPRGNGIDEGLSELALCVSRDAVYLKLLGEVLWCGILHSWRCYCRSQQLDVGDRAAEVDVSWLHGLGLHHLMVVPSCLLCSPGSAVVEWGNRT